MFLSTGERINKNVIWRILKLPEGAARNLILKRCDFGAFHLGLNFASSKIRRRHEEIQKQMWTCWACACFSSGLEASSSGYISYSVYPNFTRGLPTLTQRAWDSCGWLTSHALTPRLFSHFVSTSSDVNRVILKWRNSRARDKKFAASWCVPHVAALCSCCAKSSLFCHKLAEEGDDEEDKVQEEAVQMLCADALLEI